MILSIFISQIKDGNTIYWDFSPKKYYDIKVVKIYSTINVTIADIKMNFVNIYTSKILVNIGKIIDSILFFTYYTVIAQILTQVLILVISTKFNVRSYQEVH